MKKMNKASKIALSTSLALVTLVPIISVAATSCGSQSSDKSDTTTPSTDVQKITFDSQRFEKMLSNCTYSKLTENNNELLISDFESCCSQHDLSGISVSDLSQDANNSTISFKMNVPSDKYSIVDQNSQPINLNFSNIKISPSTTVSNVVKFDKDNFITEVSKLSYDDATSTTKIQALVNQCGITNEQLAISNAIAITGNDQVSYGTPETVSITIKLNDKFTFEDKTSTLTLSDLTTSTIKTDKLETNALSESKITSINQQLKSLNDVTEENVENVLTSSGLPKEAIQSIDLKNGAKTPGQPISFSFTIHFNKGYTYNDNSEYTSEQILTTNSYIYKLGNINNDIILNKCKELDSSNINLDNLSQTLVSAGFVNGSVNAISFVKDSDLQPGSQIIGSLTINLNNGYTTADNKTSYVLEHVQVKDTVPTHINTITLNVDSFKTWVNAQKYSNLTSEVIYKELSSVITSTDNTISELIKSNINSIVTSIDVKQSETQTPGKPINVIITLGLSSAYKFANSTSKTIESHTSDNYVQSCKYDLTKVCDAISKLSLTETQQEIKNILEQNGLPSGSIDNVTVKQSQTQTPGQAISVNVSISLNQNYTLGDESSSFIAHVSDIYNKVIDCNHGTFDESIKQKEVSNLQGEQNLAAIKQEFINDTGIQSEAIKSLTVSTNTPSLGQNYVATINVTLNNGYIFKSTNKNELLFTVTLNQQNVQSIKKESIQTVLNAINNVDYDSVNQEYLNHLINNSQIKNEIKSCTLQTKDIQQTSKNLIVNVSVTLNNGYVFSDDDDNTTSEATFEVSTKTLNTLWVDYPAFGNDKGIISQESYDSYINSSELQCVESESNLTTEEKESLKHLGEPGTDNLITPDSFALSPVINSLMTKFAKDPKFGPAICNEILYTFKNRLNWWEGKWGIDLKALSFPSTFVALNSLESSNTNGNLVINGRLGFEILNNSISANPDAPITINRNNQLLRNNNIIRVNSGEKFGVCYDFENSKVVPYLDIEDGTNGNKIAKLGYQIEGVKVTTIGNGKVYKAQIINDFRPFLDETIINIPLPGIATSSVSTYYSMQPQFASYLSSLSQDSLQKQIIAQDNAIHSFVNQMASGLDSILGTLATDPTIGDFLKSLGNPVNSILYNLTRNKPFADFVSGIFTTNEPIYTYLFGTDKDGNPNATAAEFKKIVDYIRDLLSKNPYYENILKNIFGSIIPSNPTPSNYSITPNQFLTLSTIALVASSDETSKPMGEQFVDVLKGFASSKDFLTTYVAKLYKDVTTESFIQFLGGDIQYLLEAIINATKDTYGPVNTGNGAQTVSRNNAWTFLDGIDVLLKAIEKDQNIDNENILNIKLFDVIDTPEQQQEVIKFVNNYLQAFLDIVAPASGATLKKVMPFVSQLVNAFDALNLNHLPTLFEVLSKPEVEINGQWTPVTFSDVFTKYITFTPTVTVSSYDQTSHKITYTNSLDFKFNKTIQLDVKPIKAVLGDATIGTILQQLNTILKLNLKGSFTTHQFIDAITKKFNINLPDFIMSIASTYVPWGGTDGKDKGDTDYISKLKLSELLPDTVNFVQGEGIKTTLSAENAYLNPTVVFNKITWWINTEMNLDINLPNSALSLINPMAERIGKLFTDYNNTWSSRPIGSALSSSVISTAKGIVDNFVDRTYNFITGWVNQEITSNPDANNYVNNVENLNYSVIQTPTTSLNNSEIYKILGTQSYQKTYTSSKGGTITYYPTNQDALNNALLPLIINETQTKWITDSSVPANLKPTIVIQYRPDLNVNVTINVLGSHNIPISIPGQYVIDVKFPMAVPVSTDGGKTYTMQDTISITLPADQPKATY